MNKHITFRLATIDDLPKIVEIYNQSIPPERLLRTPNPLVLNLVLIRFKEHVSKTRPPFIILLTNRQRCHFSPTVAPPHVFTVRTA